MGRRQAGPPRRRFRGRRHRANPRPRLCWLAAAPQFCCYRAALPQVVVPVGRASQSHYTATTAANKNLCAAADTILGEKREGERRNGETGEEELDLLVQAWSLYLSPGNDSSGLMIQLYRVVETSSSLPLTSRCRPVDTINNGEIPLIATLDKF